MSGSRLYTPPDELVPAGHKLFGPSQLLIDLPTYTQISTEIQALRDAEKERYLAIEAKAEEAEKGFDDALYEVGDEGRTKEPAAKRKKPDGLVMPIFDISVVEKRLQYDPTSTGDRDERRVRNLRLEMIHDSGAERKLGQVQVDTEARLDSLGVDFPNFAEVISYLRGVVAIAHADDRTAQPANILLNGPPGIGKTLFSQCIANILGTEMCVAHMETMQTSSDLVGNSYTYSNACTGLIFNTLIEAEYANPLILLDELDKCSGDTRHPPITALYNLLEGTSSSFHDESQPWLELDASRILYFATSNSVETIDPGILSRFRVFDIEAPSRHESVQIIENIFTQIQSTRPRAFSNLLLNGSAIEKLLDLSPRKIKAALTTAAGNALIAGRTHVCDVDVEDEPERKRQTIGFVS